MEGGKTTYFGDIGKTPKRSRTTSSEVENLSTMTMHILPSKCLTFAARSLREMGARYGRRLKPKRFKQNWDPTHQAGSKESTAEQGSEVDLQL